MPKFFTILNLKKCLMLLSLVLSIFSCILIFIESTEGGIDVFSYFSAVVSLSIAYLSSEELMDLFNVGTH